MLEVLRIPYTHSGVLASALAMQKDLAKTVLAAAGVPVAHGLVVDRHEAARRHAIEPPYVLKPVSEGSSFGVVIVKEDRAHPPQEVGPRRLALRRRAARRKIRRRQGTDLRGHGRAGVRHHRDRGRFPKRSTDMTQSTRKADLGHILPANLKPNIYHKVQDLTLRAHRALGCRGVSRADFRFDETKGDEGELVCLEVNTQPGMTETSLVPDMAAYAGMSFGELVAWMVEDASCDR